jgi:hypothetical protein
VQDCRHNDDGHDWIELANLEMRFRTEEPDEWALLQDRYGPGALWKSLYGSGWFVVESVSKSAASPYRCRLYIPPH